eukprot:gene7491-3093_t
MPNFSTLPTAATLLAASRRTSTRFTRFIQQSGLRAHRAAGQRGIEQLLGESDEARPYGDALKETLHPHHRGMAESAHDRSA